MSRKDSGPPIFVTSLARGGTTAILNAFHDMPIDVYDSILFEKAKDIYKALVSG